MAAEPEEFLPALFESEPLVHLVLRGYLRGLLEGQRIRPGVDPDEAADYLTRMLVSCIGSPGSWDLADREAVRRLVRMQFLAGVVDLGPTGE